MKRALHFAALMALLVSFSFDFWDRAPAQRPAPAGNTGYTLGSKINPSLNLAGYWGTATSYNHGFLIDGQNRKMTFFDSLMACRPRIPVSATAEQLAEAIC